MGEYNISVVKQLSVLQVSHTEVTTFTLKTHSHEKKEATSSHVTTLFEVAETLINDSTQTIDSILLTGKQPDNKEFGEKILDDQTLGSPNKFNSPLCVLRSIGYEIMTCKDQSGDFANELHLSTLAILEKLSGYSWEGKAIMALTAFALEYGEFSLLTHFNHSQVKLANSMALLKRVPKLFEILSTRKEAITGLNNLIKATLQVIKYVDQLEKLSSHANEIPELTEILKGIPANVYFIILTLVACATEIALVTEETEKPNYMPQLIAKISDMSKTLVEQYRICSEHTVIKEDYANFTLGVERATQVTEVFKAMKIWENVQSATQVDISTVLNEKYVLVFMSSLEITSTEFKVLKSFYSEVKSKQQDKLRIVWVPIVDKCQWTDELTQLYKKKYEEFTSEEFTYYAVQTSNNLAVRYMMENWRYKSTSSTTTTSVLLNSYGTVDHYEALQLYDQQGIGAFPHLVEEDDTLLDANKWIQPIVQTTLATFDQRIATTIHQENQYILFYGGKEDWASTFDSKAQIFTKHTTLQKSRVSMVSIKVGNYEHKQMQSFWSEIKKKLVTSLHQKESTVVTKQVQELYAYNAVESWAMLIRGSTFVTSAHGETTLKVMDNIDQWSAKVTTRETFEESFIEHHLEVLKKHGVPSDLSMCTLTLNKTEVAVFPNTMRCSVCTCETMEMASVTYECRHPSFLGFLKNPKV